MKKKTQIDKQNKNWPGVLTWFQASGKRCKKTSPNKLPTAKLRNNLSVL